MLYEICVYIDSLLFMKYSKKMHMKCSFRVPQQLTLSHWEFRLQGARTLVDPREIIQGILFYMVFYEGKKHCVCWQLSTMGEFWNSSKTDVSIIILHNGQWGWRVYTPTS